MNRLAMPLHGLLGLLGLLLLVASPACAQEVARPYGAGAPWNLSISELERGLERSDVTHADSDRLVDRLWNHTDRPGNFNLMRSYAVYRIDRSNLAEMENKVVFSDHGWGNLNGSEIPWHHTWQGAGSHPDQQVIVWDETNGREWNLWRVRTSETALEVGNGNLIEAPSARLDGEVEPIDYRTYEASFRSSRGAGIQYGAMLITQRDIERGVIDHALSLRIPVPDGRVHVAPATKQEHTDSISGIPLGTRFALAASPEQIEQWANQQSVVEPRYAKMLARALVDYGFFVTDTSWGGRHLSSNRTEEEVQADIAASRTASNSFDVESGLTARLWAEIGFEGTAFRDLLDGLIRLEDLYAVMEVDPNTLAANGSLFSDTLESGSVSNWGPGTS